MKTLHVDPIAYDEYSDFDCIKEDLFLVKNICKGHQRARDDLVKKYSSYIDTEAEYYSNVHVSAKELVQEGIYGLLCATKKFNPKKSKDFGAYATERIRKYMAQLVIDVSYSIHVSEPQKRAQKKIENFVPQFEQEQQRAPTTDELMSALNISEIYIPPCYVCPLDEIEDVVDDGQDIQHLCSHQELQEIVQSLLRILSPKQGELIRKRFFEENNTSPKRKDIAQELGMTEKQAKNVMINIKRKLITKYPHLKHCG